MYLHGCSIGSPVGGRLNCFPEVIVRVGQLLPGGSCARTRPPEESPSLRYLEPLQRESLTVPEALILLLVLVL